MRRSAVSGRGFLCLFSSAVLAFASIISMTASFESSGRFDPGGPAPATGGSFSPVNTDGWIRTEPDLTAESIEMPLAAVPASGKTGRAGGRSWVPSALPPFALIACGLYGEDRLETVKTGRFAERIADALHEQDGMK